MWCGDLIFFNVAQCVNHGDYCTRKRMKMDGERMEDGHPIMGVKL